MDAIVTEDSDLLLFGGRRMVFKLGPEYTGKELALEALCEVASAEETADIDLRGWSHEQFVQCCILAGCDYLKNPRGIAFKTAHALFEKFRSVQNVLTYLQQRPKHPVDEAYVLGFERAYLAFRYQRVWCPLQRAVVSLNDFEFAKLDHPVPNGSNPTIFAATVPGMANLDVAVLGRMGPGLGGEKGQKQKGAALHGLGFWQQLVCCQNISA